MEPPTQMKAIVLTPPSSLKLATIPTPTCPPNSLLIRVHACAITRNELTWLETLARKDPIPCHDVSGTIVAIGPEVLSTFAFQLGDPVIALISFSRDGAAAEYVVALPEELTRMPGNFSWIQAATLPLSALSAWEALFVHAGIDPDACKGTSLLITGGAGGVGVMAIQLGVAFGMKVSATGSERSRHVIEACGAHAFLDYTTPDWWKGAEGRKWDYILDTAGGETLRRCLSLVKEGGFLVSVNDEVQKWKTAETENVRAKFFIVKPDGKQLGGIVKLVEAGKIRSFVDTVFPLEEAAKAFELVEHGASKGKVVLAVSEESK
ncbi:MAG: hypothetical protein M1814_001318 [Vezdaea aestivalis]|nr:MAG: hypothetical protein M1814_001318 [Vezdaea aestivalis]